MATTANRRSADDGFSMLEAMVAASIVAICLVGSIGFVLTALRTTRAQASLLFAVTLATDAVETARTQAGSAVLKGRDLNSVQAQWSTATARVRAVVGANPLAVDSTAASGSGATATLPTVPTVTTDANGVTYRRSYFVNRCWQPTDGTTCQSTATGTAYLLVVVDLDWSVRGQCDQPPCEYVTAAQLAANNADAVFDPFADTV